MELSDWYLILSLAAIFVGAVAFLWAVQAEIFTRSSPSDASLKFALWLRSRNLAEKLVKLAVRLRRKGEK